MKETARCRDLDEELNRDNSWMQSARQFNFTYITKVEMKQRGVTSRAFWVIVFLAIPVILLVCFALIVMPFFRIPVIRPPLPKVPMMAPEAAIKHAVSIVFAAGNVQEALKAVQEEQKRTRDEREAFTAFIDQVKATSSKQSQVKTGPLQSTAGLLTPSATTHNRVQQAYEETVMAVPHYEEEYNDTVAESLAEELGPAVSDAITSGQQFSPVLKQQLVHASRESKRERDAFLKTLETEQCELKRAIRTLQDMSERLESTFVSLPSELSNGELIESHGSLDEAEQDCAALLSDRQHQRINGHAAIEGPRHSIPDLQSYLYNSLPVTYPVLADGTTLLEKVNRTKRQIMREFAARF